MSEDARPDTWAAGAIRHRARVVIDNDYCGDPDGVAQLAHHLLCRSVDIRFVVGSAVAPHHPQWTPTCGDASAAVARRVAELAGRADVPIYPGSADGLTSPDQPVVTDAARALVAEAMRDDTELPLFVACGGGLTLVASAWLLEPRIADRIIMVWNGGESYDLPAGDLPADVRYRETNINTDPIASRVVFNDSTIPLWQMPNGVFSLALASRAELLTRVRPHGPLGEHVYASIGARVDAWGRGLRMGETYGLGDCPLVLLTALGGAFDPEPYTSRWADRPRPQLTEDLLYEERPGAAPIRVFTWIDVRLLFEDFYAKLALHAAGLA